VAIAPSAVGAAPATVGILNAVAAIAERLSMPDAPPVRVCVAYVKSALPVAGAPPAPPPTTKAPVASNAEDVSTVVELKYGIPPLVTVPLIVSGNTVDPAGHAWKLGSLPVPLDRKHRPEVAVVTKL